MSSASDPLPTGYSILGGIPLANPDHAASIVFIIAFVMPLILTIFRFVRPKTRTKALIRPIAFDLLRIITYALRYHQASGDYSTGLFITTQIMFSLGLLFMAEPLLALMNEAARSGISRGTSGGPGLLRLLGSMWL
jgi:small-conductance mechanosensitive channel